MSADLYMAVVRTVAAALVINILLSTAPITYVELIISLQGNRIFLLATVKFLPAWTDCFSDFHILNFS